MEEIEEIKKLGPAERIRKLKEVEDERRKEIAEAEALIRDSEIEIKDATQKKHAPIRQATAHDISQLLTAEEKRMFKTARFADETPQSMTPEEDLPAGQTLEEAAQEADIKKSEVHGPLYGEALDKARKGIDYGSRITTTGAGQGQKIYSNEQASVQTVYSSTSVTGEEGKSKMYERSQVEERTTGLYGRNQEEKERKRKLEREPW